MRTRLFAVLALAAAGSLLAAPKPAATMKPFDLDPLRIPHKSFVLGNGLTLIVHEDHSAPLVAVNLWYHVGSRNEKRGRTGFAHLFEHFFFNGSQNYPHGFREAMDDLGATNRNGTTNTDRTNFFEDVPLAGLERTLYLEADRMGFLAANISQEMLERERGVVQNEKRQGENEPYGRVFDRITETIYPSSHPYSWSTIGSMEDLDSAALTDVKKWYATYYGPNNCVLSMAGDITAEDALALVTKYFASIPPGPPIPRYERWVPELDTDLRDTIEDRVPQARIYRVYHAPAWGERELHDLELAAAVLSGSTTARLDRRLVYDKQLATAVSADLWDKELASDFIITVTVKNGVDPKVAEAEMDAVISDLMEKGPTADELQRGSTRLVAGFARGIERLGGRGGRSDVLAESATFGGSPDSYMTRLEDLTRATPSQVRETSRKWLSRHHYTGVVVPFAAREIPKETLDRTKLPSLTENPAARFPEVQKATLSNGLKVLLLERHSVPLVNMTLAVDAGNAADPKGAAGTGTLTLDTMDDGTKTRDAFRIAEELDALGATISTARSADLSMVKLRALRPNLAPSLELFADVIVNPSFPAPMVEIARKQQLAAISREKATPIATAGRLAPVLLYGTGHPYGNPASGYEQEVAKLTTADLAAWHRAWFRPNASTLIVAGDVAMKDLLPQVEKAFGAWERGVTPEKTIANVPSSPAKGMVYLVDKPGAPQSVVVAAHLSLAGGQDDSLALDTVMQNFGGMATSRLNRNLRLDKHWSYGTRGQITAARGQRPLIVIAPVQTDKTRESMVEVLREIRGAAGERPVRGEEFDSIKRNVALRLAGRYQTLGALEDAGIEMVNYGYPPEYFYSYGQKALALSEEDLAKAAARYLQPGELTWIVIGDLARVEPGIRELGYGKIVHVDADGKVLD